MFYDRYVSLCAKKGVSPSRAALEAGISKSLVSKWKANESKEPSPEVIRKLADYFGIPAYEVLEDIQQKERPHVPEDIGPNKQILDFEKATKALSEAINKLNAGECTAKLGAEDIKVICPIDGTEQIIHQTYAIIGGKRFAQENNGCDNYSGHKECDLCRWRVTLKVTNG